MKKFNITRILRRQKIKNETYESVALKFGMDIDNFITEIYSVSPELREAMLSESKIYSVSAGNVPEKNIPCLILSDKGET